jgi:hypothetical protein
MQITVVVYVCDDLILIMIIAAETIQKLGLLDRDADVVAARAAH